MKNVDPTTYGMIVTLYRDGYRAASIAKALDIDSASVVRVIRASQEKGGRGERDIPDELAEVLRAELREGEGPIGMIA